MVKSLFVGLAAGAFLLVFGTSAMAQIDNYRCYKVKDLTDPKMEAVEGVAVNDPGDPNALVDVKKKMKWACAPTDMGGGVIDDVDWLCGYKIKGEKIDPRPQFVLTNQFQFPATVEVIKSDILLTPCADPNAIP